MQNVSKEHTYLTKSRYVNGLNCAKEIWLMFNDPKSLPKIDQATQNRFDEGHKVGELAKLLFPTGIEITKISPKDNDKISRELLKERRPLFEAGFIHSDGKCYARADILVPSGKSEWDIIEVKSAASVKEYYLDDISFQKYCYEGAGLKIRKSFVFYVNKEYVKDGDINPQDFFMRGEVTESIDAKVPKVHENVIKLLKITKLKECPEFTRGENYHDDPHGVHENDRFWKENPDSDILDMYRGGKKAAELFDFGIIKIKDIPEDYELNEKQIIQKMAHSSAGTHTNIKELNTFIKRINYPIYFMDFESYATAIPLYDGLRPYQQIPFQFSVHVLKNKGQKPTHISFLAKGSKDPRAKFIAELKKAIGTKGSILVYNQSFEQSILEKLAQHSPKYKKWVASIIPRLVDLLVPFRNFHYYHPHQKGSVSLKHVLPALTGMTYGDLPINNGSQASLSYLFITHGAYLGKHATKKEMREIRNDLEKYCGQDTEGMVRILDKLEGICQGSQD